MAKTWDRSAAAKLGWANRRAKEAVASNPSMAHMQRYFRTLQARMPSNVDLPNPNIGKPDFGDESQPLPHVITFNSIFARAFSRTYRISDQAMRNSEQDALAMENDLAVMECMESRWRAVAQLPWHIDVQDPKDPRQVEAANTLTQLVEGTKDFTEFLRSLLEANWRGRHGMQLGFTWKQIAGSNVKLVDSDIPWANAWVPINGDKLAFGWDDPGRVAIRINPTAPDLLRRYGNIDQLTFEEDQNIEFAYRNRKLEVLDGFGLGFFLDKDELERIIIHRHQIEDAAFNDPTSAGKIHGVGIRHRIYWTWFQKQSALELLFESFERGALGLEVWRYPMGNEAGYNAMVNAMQERVAGAGRNALMVPVIPGMEDSYGVDLIPYPMDGINGFKEIIHEFFNHQIKRYILGQILSSEPEAGGLGSSGITDFQKDSLQGVLRYDADKLSETMTHQFLPMLIRRNRHVLPVGAQQAGLYKFVLDTEADDMEEQVEAIKQVWEMGLPIKEDALYQITKIEKPTLDDKLLPNPQDQQQPDPMGGGMPPMGMMERDGEPDRYKNYELRERICGAVTTYRDEYPYPDYGDVFWDPDSKTVHYVGGDGEEHIDVIEEDLKSITGVKHVVIADEYYPDDDEGDWIKLDWRAFRDSLSKSGQPDRYVAGHGILELEIDGERVVLDRNLRFQARDAGLKRELQRAIRWAKHQLHAVPDSKKLDVFVDTIKQHMPMRNVETRYKQHHPLVSALAKAGNKSRYKRQPKSSPGQKPLFDDGPKIEKPQRFSSSNFDESKISRGDSGTDKGGQFVSKGDSGKPTEKKPKSKVSKAVEGAHEAAKQSAAKAHAVVNDIRQRAGELGVNAKERATHLATVANAWSNFLTTGNAAALATIPGTQTEKFGDMGKLVQTWMAGAPAIVKDVMAETGVSALIAQGVAAIGFAGDIVSPGVPLGSIAIMGLLALANKEKVAEKIHGTMVDVWDVADKYLPEDVMNEAAMVQGAAVDVANQFSDNPNQRFSQATHQNPLMHLAQSLPQDADDQYLGVLFAVLDMIPDQQRAIQIANYLHSQGITRGSEQAQG